MTTKLADTQLWQRNLASLIRSGLFTHAEMGESHGLYTVVGVYGDGTFSAPLDFDPGVPLLVGGVLPAEEGTAHLQLRLKRHRWFPKTLKTRDPLVFSIGARLAILLELERRRLLRCGWTLWLTVLGIRSSA